jgi:hypothetical protein
MPVEHHVAPDHTEGYSAEVLNALGDTLTVITVPDSELKPLREDKVVCARLLAAVRSIATLCEAGLLRESWRVNNRSQNPARVTDWISADSVVDVASARQHFGRHPGRCPCRDSRTQQIAGASSWGGGRGNPNSNR